MTKAHVDTSGGFLGAFFLVLFVLKVGVGDTSVEQWSWWWVTAPLWGVPALVGAVVVGALLVAAILDGVDYLLHPSKREEYRHYRKMRKRRKAFRAQKSKAGLS